MADINTFKKLVSALESSDNPDVRHPAAVKGVSKGDEAIGQYGLMPNTVKELANRAKLADENTMSDDMIMESPNNQVSEMLRNNPELMQLYVDRLSKHVLDKSQNDPESAYMRWLYGHNLPDSRVEKLKKKDTKTMGRIKDVIEQKHFMSQPPNPLEIPEPYIDKPFTSMKKK